MEASERTRTQRNLSERAVHAAGSRTARAILTLMRPYGLSEEGLYEVTQLLDNLLQKKRTRALIVTGNVEEAFLADVAKASLVT